MESNNSARYSACDFRSYPEEALGLPYYHPTLATIREVRDLLLEYLGSNGFFLLRKSFTKASTLTVSVVFSRTVKHFTLSQKETGAFFLQEKLFASIQDLVSYYGRQEVPNKEGLSGVYLKHPVLDLKRHHFFASTSQRLASVDETKAEAWTKSSCREMQEGRRTDRIGHINLTSQSSSVKAAHPNKKSDGGKGNSSRSSSAIFEQRSSQHRPLSGYLSLNLTHPPEATPSASASRPMSLGGGTGWVRERSSGFEPVLPGDRSSSSEQPARFSSQPRSLQERPHPQQQLPEEAHRTVDKSHSLMQAAKAPQLLYCYARSPYTQLATALVDRLREIEGDNASKCHCGIYHDDAELPRGWAIHRSTEPETYGRVLFTGPDGQSDWNLPLEVSLELSAEQQDKIRELICRPPPRPRSRSFDEVGSGSGSVTNADNESEYQSLLLVKCTRDTSNHSPADEEKL